MEGTTKRVDYDDLDYTSEAIYVFEGTPFTGVGVETWEDGSVRCEISFLEGKEHGPARDFHRNGNLAGETVYVSGKRHGLEREWSADGRLVAESVHESGILMKTTKWSKDGEAEIVYERPTDDPMYELVVKQRSQA